MKILFNRFYNSMKKNENIILVLLLIGLVVRIIYVSQIKILPWNDMAMWDKARLSILQGTKYDVNWPPVYPLFLAALSFLFGNSYIVIGIAQSVVSSLTCLLIYLIAKDTFNNKVGLISLAISCFYIDMFWYSGVLLAETLGLFLFTLVIYFIIKEKSHIITGFLFGLTLLTKGVFLITLPGIILWLFLKSDKNKVVSNISRFVILTFLTISPWTVRNYFEYKSFVLLEPHYGINVFVGHNPSATGGADYYFIDYDYGKFYKDDSLSIVEKSRIGLKIAFDFAVTHPFREIQLFFLKLSKYCTLSTHFDFYSAGYPLRKTFFVLAILTHSMLFPLFILGMVFSLKNKNAIGLTIIICNFTLVLITLFCVYGRMRFSSVSSIIILASYGISVIPEILDKLKRNEFADISKKLKLTVILTALLYANFIMQAITRSKDILNRFK